MVIYIQHKQKLLMSEKGLMKLGYLRRQNGKECERPDYDWHGEWQCASEGMKIGEPKDLSYAKGLGFSPLQNKSIWKASGKKNFCVEMKF